MHVCSIASLHDAQSLTINDAVARMYRLSTSGVLLVEFNDMPHVCMHAHYEYDLKMTVSSRGRKSPGGRFRKADGSTDNISFMKMMVDRDCDQSISHL